MLNVFFATMLWVFAGSVLASETIANPPHVLHYDLDVGLDVEGEKVSVLLSASRIANTQTHRAAEQSGSALSSPMHFALRKGAQIRYSNVQWTHLPQPNGLYDVYQMQGAWPGSDKIELDYVIDMAGVSAYSSKSSFNNSSFNKSASNKKSVARSFELSNGEVSTRGVYLSGASYWYPVFEDTWYTFAMTVKNNKGFKSISQGWLDANTWRNEKPNPEIFLIANAFHVYSEQFNQRFSQQVSQQAHHATVNKVALEAYLRQPDVGLAQQYLEAASRYLTMYQDLLGSYPYRKFALIENFWESGYGMPSFTLLGSEVIRLPFILHSSYPHELVHNWLGNGVFPPAGGENWSEGLTTYLADHLFAEQKQQVAEQKQQGAFFRRDSMQRYINHESLALVDFSYKKSASSEAVGYVKGMMLWEMLRNRIGDEAFKTGVKNIIKRYLFKEAGFAQLQREFEQVSGRDLSLFFNQWTTRTDIPQLRLVQAKWLDSRRIEITLAQEQAGSAYDLDVPVHFCGKSYSHKKQTFENKRSENKTLEKSATMVWLRMTQKKQRFIVAPECRTQWVEVDPQFQIMRALYANESPMGLRQALASDSHYLLASALNPALHPELNPELNPASAIQQKVVASLLAATSQGALSVIPVHPDQQWQQAPKSTLWLPDDGKTQAFNTWLVEPEKLQSARRVAHSTDYFVFGRNPQHPEQKVVLFNLAGCMNNAVNTRANPSNCTLDEGSRLHSLLHKLPHYRKYSYLGFRLGHTSQRTRKKEDQRTRNQEVENSWKGQWPVKASPMKMPVFAAVVLNTPDTTGAVPSVVDLTTAHSANTHRSALAQLPQAFSQAALKQHVDRLTNHTMQGRGLGTEGIQRAADYIFNAFNAVQKSIGVGRAFRQPFTAQMNGVDAKPTQLATENIVLVLPGSRSNRAPTDTDQSHKIQPDLPMPPVVVSAHYDHLGLAENGEVYTGADDNASGVAALLLLAEHFAKKSLARDVIFVAFSAEETGRQGALAFLAEPAFLAAPSLSAPSLADWGNGAMANVNLDSIGRLNNKPIQILNSDSAREWKPIFHGVGYLTGLTFDTPNLAIAPSDQGAFLDHGIPAIQLFAGAHFDIHTPRDTADKLDYAGMQNITRAAAEVIEYLANRNEPLTSRLKNPFANAHTDSRSSTKTDASNKSNASKKSVGKRKVRTGMLPDYGYAGAGIKIEQIEPGTGAAKAGLKPGDVILQMGATTITHLAQYSQVLQQYQPGQTVQITLSRESEQQGASTLTLEVTLDER